MILGLPLWLACAGPDAPGPGTPGSDTAGTEDTDPAADTDTALDTDTDTAADTDTDEDTDIPGDADGDGHAASEHGGADCDDTNPWVHPGATEYCDTVDQDCDGEPLAPGVCGRAAVLQASGHQVLDTLAFYGGAGTVGDVTGDGLTDLGFMRIVQDDLLLYAGDPSFALHTDAPGEAWHHFENDGFEHIEGAVRGGDVDGDGIDDLLLSETYGWGVSIHFGPIAGPGERSDSYEDRDGLWPSWLQTDYTELVLSGEDLDGDGRADGITRNDRVISDTVYQLHFGGEYDAPGDHPRCDVRRNGGGTSSAEGGQIATIGDADGDGLPEFALRMTDHGYVVSGADARALCDTYVEDMALGVFDLPYAGSVHGDLGDLDGDGISEFLLGKAPTLPGEDALYFLSGTVAVNGYFDVAEALGSFQAPTEYSIYYTQMLDFDGDGVKELLITETFGGPLHIVRGGTLPGPHDPLPERHLIFREETSATICGKGSCVGDFDGDGFEDLVGGYMDSDVGVLDTWIIRGFDVPWDEDVWW